jgi:hypothetical protein
VATARPAAGRLLAGHPAATRHPVRAPPPNLTGVTPRTPRKLVYDRCSGNPRPSLYPGWAPGQDFFHSAYLGLDMHLSRTGKFHIPSFTSGVFPRAADARLEESSGAWRVRTVTIWLRSIIRWPAASPAAPESVPAIAAAGFPRVALNLVT